MLKVNNTDSIAEFEVVNVSWVLTSYINVASVNIFFGRMLIF